MTRCDSVQRALETLTRGGAVGVTDDDARAPGVASALVTPLGEWQASVAARLSGWTVRVVLPATLGATAQLLDLGRDVQPWLADDGGVHAVRAIPEAAVELLLAAGRPPAALAVVPTGPDPAGHVIRWCEVHALPIVSVEEVSARFAALAAAR